MFEVRAGRAWPLGAHFDGKGTNFCVFSEAGKQVELCLFDEEGVEERLELTGREGPYWYGRVDKVLPGQRYGFRVHGPY